ncbi:hypothetical protein LCGC14_0357030 [marine sediment metagenome]|uniref:RNA polymerase sigma-70 region 4 domain-containing protein n=1 Tax=marine sediment metagenome TaxID=412755 RepID=A0A0F9TEM9_9ZZZZ
MDDKPEPYQWIADNLPLCYKVCHKVCRERAHLVDDMFSEVVLDRVPGIIERWIPEKSKLSTWVFNNLKWHCYTWLNRRGQCVVSLDAEFYSIEDKISETFDMDDADNVQYLMRSLTGYERRIVTLHVLYEQTFAEIAKRVGVRPWKIAKVYQEAIAKCSTPGM